MLTVIFLIAIPALYAIHRAPMWAPILPVLVFVAMLVSAFKIEMSAHIVAGYLLMAFASYAATRATQRVIVGG